MDSGNLAWAVTATALVLLMTPGVAFFYGGLVRAKSVISMMMLSFGAIALIAVLWILYGASMSAVDSPWQFAGNPFADLSLAIADDDTLVSTAFAATFAIITVALISGSIADRAKFGSWMVFVGVWGTLVYFPVAAWVWGGGWAMSLGSLMGLDHTVIDYAGGTAVHINAGAAALALSLVLGKRVGFDKSINRPHNVPLVLLGAAILWFGWFGFNAGAEGVAGLLGTPDSRVGLIVINTIGATAAAILGWILIEKLKTGKSTSVGAASGAVSGLVAITPACADLTPAWSLLLGLLSGIICCYAIELKWKLGYDDSLDVVGIHLAGGLLGTVYLGFFATGTGLFVGGDASQLFMQVVTALAVLVYSFVMAYAIGWIIQKTMGFRVTTEAEVAGIDNAMHGEEGYFLESTDTGPQAVIGSETLAR